tara:strand:+ start:506 stop:1135 length:630 start_codon:yes stop_codon:yes gene_type:complete
MRRAAFEINKAYSVANKAIYATASELSLLQAQLDHGHWGPFLKSGVLNMSERTAIELVGMWPVLKQYPNLETLPVLASLSMRTLAFIFSEKITGRDGMSADQLRALYLSQILIDKSLATEKGAKAFFHDGQAKKEVEDDGYEKEIKKLRGDNEMNKKVKAVKIDLQRAKRRLEKVKKDIEKEEELITEATKAQKDEASAQQYLDAKKSK